MGIHPIQGFNNLSTGKKVAVVASGVAVAGALVATGVALHKGKNVDIDQVKFKLKEGQTELSFFQKIRAGYSEMWAGIKKFFSKKTPDAPVDPNKGAEAAQDVTEEAAARAE